MSCITGMKSFRAAACQRADTLPHFSFLRKKVDKSLGKAGKVCEKLEKSRKKAGLLRGFSGGVVFRKWAVI